MKNYMFIVNPTSSRGRGQKIGTWLLEECTKLKLDYDLQFTTKPKEATEMASRAYKDFEYIVAVGGDGTLQEVINGLVDAETKVGIIPVGTGNDFVRAAGIPFQADQALKTLLDGHVNLIDIGKAGDRFFHNGIGIGFDAWVVNESLKIKYLRGNIVYLLAIFKTLLSYKSPEIEILYNNNLINEKLFLISVGNGTSMGGGIKLTPFAKIDDGVLDLTIIQDVNKFKILQNLVKAYSGKHVYMPQVKVDTCKSVQIKSENGMAVQADGELISCNLKELKIDIIPKAIKFVTPKEIN